MPTQTPNVKKLFESDRLNASFIIINVLVLYLSSFDSLGAYALVFDYVDMAFTVFFVIELSVLISKRRGNGLREKTKNFLHNPWHKIDFFSTLMAIPSIGALIYKDAGFFAGFIALRSLRIFKLIPIIVYIPNGKRITEQIVTALRSIMFILVVFLVYTTVITLIATSLFKASAPQYFDNAFDGYFTIFRIFTGDGYSAIINTIAQTSGPLFVAFTKVFFVVIVFSGSILGISLINSIFINEMNQLSRKEAQKEISEFHEIKRTLEDIARQNAKLTEKVEELQQEIRKNGD